jgi:hypothetical protein
MFDSKVPVVSGAVPIAVAGEPEDVEELEEPEFEDEEGDAVEALDDDDVELPDEGCSALCIAAVSSVLTRFKAVPLAILARPFAKLVSAWPITSISEASALEA